jgi:hypothetical protein
MNCLNRLAGAELWALSAGCEPFLKHAFSYLAHIGAVRRFDAIRAAAHAVDHVPCDGRMICLRPKACRFFSQRVIIGDGGDARVAFFAVESTARYQFFMVLPSFFLPS